MFPGSENSCRVRGFDRPTGLSFSGVSGGGLSFGNHIDLQRCFGIVLPQTLYPSTVLHTESIINLNQSLTD